MKATGIIRRVDDLGRVEIAASLRRQLNIREDDPIEFCIMDKGLFIRKYQPKETGKPKSQSDKLMENPDALAAFLSLISYEKIEPDSLFCKSNCDDEECPHELQGIIDWLNSPEREDKAQ